MRHECRAWERYAEHQSGIEILNPFYDVYREEIIKIDCGIVEKYDRSFDHMAIVTNDLSYLDSCDAVLAIIEEANSIGTHCELWHSVNVKKPVYVITGSFENHPWIRYATESTGGLIFPTWRNFINWLREEKEAELERV
jgi:nucleoside 2-deoxyribosyltransferase